MQSLLKFNPYFRMTAYECIQSKVFDAVRDENKEKILHYMNQENQALHNMVPQAQGFKSADNKFQVSSPKSKPATTFEQISSSASKHFQNRAMIELAIDSSDAFDYENPDNAKYSVNDLKFILHKEVVEIQSTTMVRDCLAQKSIKSVNWI